MDRLILAMAVLDELNQQSGGNQLQNIVQQAVRRFKGNNDIADCIANVLKNQFGGTWTCIVGDTATNCVGSFVRGRFESFQVDGKRVYVFKHQAN